MSGNDQELKSWLELVFGKTIADILGGQKNRTWVEYALGPIVDVILKKVKETPVSVETAAVMEATQTLLKTTGYCPGNLSLILDTVNKVIPMIPATYAATSVAYRGGKVVFTIFKRRRFLTPGVLLNTGSCLLSGVSCAVGIVWPFGRTLPVIAGLNSASQFLGKLADKAEGDP